MKTSLPISPNISRRAAILGVGFACTAGIAAAVTPRRHEQTLGHARLASVIPNRVNDWTAVPSDSLILPEATGAPDDFYDQVLTRAFSMPGRPVIMLLIAYGAAQSGMMKVHRPEVCYTSAGFKILNDQHTSVQLESGRTIPAKTFHAEREGRSEQVLYWTRISDSFPSDLLSQRLVTMERGLSGVIPDGVLVRVSTIEPNWTTGQAAMHDFSQALVSQAPPLGKALLAGSTRSTAIG